MEKLEQYRHYIKQILEHYAQFKPSYGDLTMQLIFDEARDSYQLMTIGWLGYDRYHGSILHVELKDGLIWIQHDGTEGGIANELVELGGPKSELCWHLMRLISVNLRDLRRLSSSTANQIPLYQGGSRKPPN